MAKFDLVEFRKRKLDKLIETRQIEAERALYVATNRGKLQLKEGTRYSPKSHEAEIVTFVNIDLARIDNLKKVIKKCKEARERLKNDTYGYCADCGKPIPMSRLMAVNFTDKCVQCKEKKEKKDLTFIEGRLLKGERVANTLRMIAST